LKKNQGNFSPKKSVDNCWLWKKEQSIGFFLFKSYS
jgi:hypothetical protein